MIKYLGTHNSGTSSQLVWWQRPFAWILHLTSRCQSLSIEEQLLSNVRLFNLQITWYKDDWVFSHGLCIYKDKVDDAISLMEKYATKESPIYLQIYLDKNFFLTPNIEEFRLYIEDLKKRFRTSFIYIIYDCIECIGIKNYHGVSINSSEHHWSKSWAQYNAKSWIDYIPWPKRHAKKYNKKYIAENKADYLMLDFVE